MKFLLCGGGLYPLPARKILDMAKNAGFDGAEIFLFGTWTQFDIIRVMQYADKLRLEVHFHQVWSKEESSDAAAATINKVLRLFGQIPADGYSLKSILPSTEANVVVYANYMDQAPVNGWVQTLSTGFGEPRLPYVSFVEAYLVRKFPVVFDTTHYLEYALGMHGVSALKDEDVEMSWRFGWNLFGKTVREVHFNDFDPSLGDAKGRNLLPGTGKAPLKSFVDILEEAQWDGYVVPEFRWDLVKWSPRRLLDLRKSMERYFGG